MNKLATINGDFRPESKTKRAGGVPRPSREQAEQAVSTLIRWSGDDPDREGLVATPARVVRAYEEWFSGYDENPDELLQRTYEVRKDSKRYQTLVLPRLQKVATEKDLSTKQLEAARIEDLQHLQVQVHFNMLVVPMITGPDLKVDTKIPGATFVHKDRNNPFSHGVAYVLFFSNGKAGRWEEVNDVYRNFFVHKPDTPYIENIEVRIFGPEDRVKELLRKIDWKQVNSALTL